jgi:S-adenosylmethionine hydrolase
MRSIITLLTDFGTADGYVAEMKAVLLTMAPDATLVDVSHDIAPQDTEGARLALARYWRRYPPGTIHLVVIDPEVGSDRAALGIASNGRFLVGPDTGVLSPALVVPGAEVVRLEIPQAAAPTFHGRDVFAPAAARLAAGTLMDALGPPFEHAQIRRTPEPHRGPDGSIMGQVIHIDRFGNAVTNLLGAHGGTVEVVDRALPILRTYADARPGALLALNGSSGLIEIAQRDGNAARTLELSRGTRVVLRSGAL